jgi:hypothetical protein
MSAVLTSPRAMDNPVDGAAPACANDIAFHRGSVAPSAGCETLGMSAREAALVLTSRDGTSSTIHSPY